MRALRIIIHKTSYRLTHTLSTTLWQASLLRLIGMYAAILIAGGDEAIGFVSTSSALAELLRFNLDAVSVVRINMSIARSRPCVAYDGAFTCLSAWC